jgi:transposase
MLKPLPKLSKVYHAICSCKTEDQLDLQALHRVRDRLVAGRTGVINELRASCSNEASTSGKAGNIC